VDRWNVRANMNGRRMGADIYRWGMWANFGGMVSPGTQIMFVMTKMTAIKVTPAEMTSESSAEMTS
jgi:hypothetical protein